MVKKYEESKVVRALQAKRSLEIQGSKKLIIETFGHKDPSDVGIKSRGKISFLVNYCGYTHIWHKN